MKRIATVFGITLVLLAVVLVSLPFLINANQFRPMLESKLSQGLGREVKLGDLKFSVLSGGVTASDLSIADHPAFGVGFSIDFGAYRPFPKSDDYVNFQAQGDL